MVLLGPHRSEFPIGCELPEDGMATVSVVSEFKEVPGMEQPLKHIC